MYLPLRALTAFTVLASAVLLALPINATPAAATVLTSTLRDTTFRGEGDDVLRVKATKTRGIVVATYDGESNFIVYGLDRQGKEKQVLFNAIGTYSGTVLYNSTPGDTLAGLKITADGPWTLRFRPLSSAPLWKGATARGKGDAVLRLNPPSRGFRTVRARYTGESNFIVYGFTGAGFPDVLFNEIGGYNGKTSLPSGTRLIVVQADGKWSMNRR
ncbi:hypothetical protein [Streptosporangium sp. NPDC004631]